MAERLSITNLGGSVFSRSALVLVEHWECTGPHTWERVTRVVSAATITAILPNLLEEMREEHRKSRELECIHANP